MNTQTNSPKNWMVAATFAEAGEWDTAREMIPEVKLSRKTNSFFNIFAAVAFAEAGLPDEAVRISKGAVQESGKTVIKELADLELGKVHLRYGTIVCD